MLHFAPANCLEQRLRTMPGLDYFTVDLDKNNIQARMDITMLALPDNAFDLVICSHVLEHVVNDVDAMAELFRIMKNDGWALIIVPISAEETIEDSSVTDPSERLALYGQFDHVRRYGPDIHERLESVGFELEKMSEAQVVDTQQSIRFAIGDAPIFVCHKQ